MIFIYLLSLSRSREYNDDTKKNDDDDDDDDNDMTLLI